MDEADAPVAARRQDAGHLQCRGHWIAGRYFRQPDVDLQTDDGWMRTGDIAVIDPDNTLHIVDRAKDVIKSGGEWISSQALEEAAIRHPCRAGGSRRCDAASAWQERPFLIVVKQPNTEVSQEELHAHLSRMCRNGGCPTRLHLCRNCHTARQESCRRMCCDGGWLMELLSCRNHHKPS